MTKELEKKKPGRPPKERQDLLHIDVKKGAPSKYSPDMCQKILEVAAQGGHIAEMRLAIDCRSKETWYRWKEEHPEFNEAVEYADLISKVYYERLGLLGASGKLYGFNASTYALIMNNKFGDEYKRNGSSSPNTEITINQLEISPEQLMQKIAQKLEKLKSIGVVVDGSTE